MSVGAAEALEVLWVPDEQETLLGFCLELWQRPSPAPPGSGSTLSVLCPGCKGARPVLGYKALFCRPWAPHACGSPRWH